MIPDTRVAPVVDDSKQPTMSMAASPETTVPIQNSDPVSVQPETTPTFVDSSSGDEEVSNPATTPLTSAPPSEVGDGKVDSDCFATKPTLDQLVPELYSENILAKALRTAIKSLGSLPDAFPEYVPQDGGDGSYALREADFW